MSNNYWFYTFLSLRYHQNRHPLQRHSFQQFDVAIIIIIVSAITGTREAEPQ